MTKTKVAQKLEETVIEKVQDLLDEHSKTVIAIVQDYVGGDGMEHEISVAHDNLKSEIDLLDGEEPELNLDKLIEKITDHKDYDSDKLIAVLDPSDIDSYATSNGYCLIKVDNMNLRGKLEDFIKTEIYPHYADQNEFVII